MKFKRYIKESIDDMDKRCPECNTLLNDGGTCPKCDDGEEDYGDEQFEGCEGYRARKYGAYWFGITGPDDLMLRDEENKLILFKTKDEANKYIEDNCKKPLVETMSNLEKLKAAYPELNFDEPMTEEVVTEELSNWEKLVRAYPELETEELITEGCVEEELTNSEKLKRAFPELNFDEPVVEEVESKEPLCEAEGSDIIHRIIDVMSDLAKDDNKKWAKTAVDIVSVIPDNLADDLFDKVKSNFTNLKLQGSNKSKISDELGIEIDETNDTVGELFDIAENNNIKDDPELTKKLVMTVLSMIAVVEPTPVLEVITFIVKIIPANLITSVLKILTSVNPSTSVGKRIVDLVADQFKSNKEVKEDLDDPYADYDDDYDFDDDVEQDHVHAALYGGDRTYCECGRRLEYGEDGYTYCPDCDNEFNYDDNID